MSSSHAKSLVLSCDVAEQLSSFEHRKAVILAERIRTYNFPQGRVTDHRIGLTLYKLDNIMNGDLDELVDALIMADQAEKLKAVEE